MRTTQTRPVAQGVVDPRRPDYKQIVVRMDHETFDDLRARAIRERTSLSEQVRTMIEWGLESAREGSA